MSLKDYSIDKHVLHTPRLALRKMTAADADNLREWTQNKALYGTAITEVGWRHCPVA